MNEDWYTNILSNIVQPRVDSWFGNQYEPTIGPRETYIRGPQASDYQTDSVLRNPKYTFEKANPLRSNYDESRPFRPELTFPQSNEQALNMWDPGHGLAGGTVMFKTRPWLRELVGSVAGPEWLAKWSQNQRRGDLAVAGAEMIDDYAQAVGRPLGRFGVEVEGLGQRFLPGESKGGAWEIKPERAMGNKQVGSYTRPGEIVSKPPEPGEPQDIFGMLYDYQNYTRGNPKEQQGKPLFASTLKHGGGGHVSISADDLVNDPELMKQFFVEYVKNEPHIYPSVPEVKNQPRTYVEPTLQTLTNEDSWESHSGYAYGRIKRRLNEALKNNDAGWVFGGLPEKFEGGLSARGDFGSPEQRFELRNFYAPYHTGQVAENMLVAQALLDKARIAAEHSRPIPESAEDLARQVYKDVIKGNEAKISFQQFEGHPGVKGVHQEWSPFMSDLLQPETYSKPTQSVPLMLSPDRASLLRGEIQNLFNRNIAGRYREIHRLQNSEDDVWSNPGYWTSVMRPRYNRAFNTARDRIMARYPELQDEIHPEARLPWEDVINSRYHWEDVINSRYSFVDNLFR